MQPTMSADLIWAIIICQRYHPQGPKDQARTKRTFELVAVGGRGRGRVGHGCDRIGDRSRACEARQGRQVSLLGTVARTQVSNHHRSASRSKIDVNTVEGMDGFTGSPESGDGDYANYTDASTYLQNLDD